jgi:hypothetical protein
MYCNCQQLYEVARRIFEELSQDKSRAELAGNLCASPFNAGLLIDTTLAIYGSRWTVPLNWFYSATFFALVHFLRITGQLKYLYVQYNSEHLAIALF